MIFIAFRLFVIIDVTALKDESSSEEESSEEESSDEEADDKKKSAAKDKVRRLPS